MREIHFYRTEAGRCPIEEFLDTLSDKRVEKVLWVLQVIKALKIVPKQYFKKLESAHDIWEIRVNFGGETYRLLGFFDGKDLIILTNAFSKKSQKLPQNEIKLAEQRKKDYLNRRK